ncbi:hypothetical protein [Hymenobacter terrenus]|uniref:hypothetical protein n=1 Tax=Hymenobacter terrenus TaxID=1629124 RepID=UPI0006194715|nr:hypothetical protein [Hymenobacter terrenus]
MKKVFLSAALALAVAGSWAFYPKQGPSGTYMQLVFINTVGRGEINLIPDNGLATEIKVKETNLSQARVKAMIKLTELRHEGWRVTQMTSTSYNANSVIETYLLERM